MKAKLLKALKWAVKNAPLIKTVVEAIRKKKD